MWPQRICIASHAKRSSTRTSTRKRDNVVVRLERSRQGMVLRVTDDGVGLSSERKVKQGLGFHIMNYRAQLMGGRLEIASPKGGGTCVSCYLPDGASRPRKSREKEREAERGMDSKSRFAGKIAELQRLLM